MANIYFNLILEKVGDIGFKYNKYGNIDLDEIIKNERIKIKYTDLVNSKNRMYYSYFNTIKKQIIIQTKDIDGNSLSKESIRYFIAYQLGNWFLHSRDISLFFYESIEEIREKKTQLSLMATKDSFSYYNFKKALATEKQVIQSDFFAICLLTYSLNLSNINSQNIEIISRDLIVDKSLIEKRIFYQNIINKISSKN